MLLHSLEDAAQLLDMNAILEISEIGQMFFSSFHQKNIWLQGKGFSLSLDLRETTALL